METDTKAMSLQARKEILITKITSYAPVDGREFSLDEVLKAMELYKDSCLAAQKAELKSKIEAQLNEMKQFSGGSLYKKGLKKAIELIEKS